MALLIWAGRKKVDILHTAHLLGCNNAQEGAIQNFVKLRSNIVCLNQ
jgi:hypothetical protein